jgi:hypothetical protein
VSWNDLIREAIRKSGADDSVGFDALVDEIFAGESEDSREALAKKQIRQELGFKLRKWALKVEQPLIPDLLDGFVKKDDDYIHASNLSREEWTFRKHKLQRRIITLEERVTAIDNVLSQIDLPSKGEA